VSSKPKILFIPKWYPSRVHEQNGDFIERVALAVAMKHKVAVLFVCADPDMKDKSYDVAFELKHGITIVKVFYNNSLPDFLNFSPVIKFFRYLKSCRKGMRLIEEKFGTPDIAHIHVLTRPLFAAYYYNFFHKTPIVVSEHWSGYLPEDGAYKGFLKKVFTRIAIRKASEVITVSESLRAAMISHGLKNQYSTIPNVVDTQLFYPIFNKRKNDKLILLHVSNLVERAKNISGMIRAIKKLSEIRNDFEFHVIGEGMESSTHKAQAAKLGVLDRYVFFQGAQTLSQVAEAMRQADLFLLFSNYETISCVILESLASGLPVVCTNLPALQEHVKQGMGIFVSPNDEQAFCNALLKALDTIECFDKQRMSDYARQQFSYESVADKFEKLYQRVIER
jgi:glycosyltransferase involved in cell wall biosynthesis